MPTNLSTNFDPSASNLGGIELSDQNSRHDTVLDITDEILATGAASFGRVTSSSPTPAGLQSYAGGATRGSNNSIGDNQGNLSGNFDALYFKTDPALGSENQAAMFNLPMFEYGVAMQVADPVTNNISSWNDFRNPFGFNSNDNYNGNYFRTNSSSPVEEVNRTFSYYDTDAKPGNVFFSRLGNTGTERPNSSTPLGLSHRFWCFCADEYMIWKSWTIQEQRTSGVGIVWFNSSPSDGHYSRNEVPSVAARSLRRWPSNKAMAPAHQPENRGMQLTVDDDMRFVPTRGDSQGREIIQPQVAYTPNKPIPAYWGEIPALRVVRDEAVAVWDTLSIDGNNWVCFHKDGGRGYLTRYENSK